MEKLRPRKADASQDGEKMAVKLPRPGVRRLLLWDEVRIADMGPRRSSYAVVHTLRLSASKR